MDHVLVSVGVVRMMCSSVWRYIEAKVLVSVGVL